LSTPEIAGRVLGYMAQVNHSIPIGASSPRDWADAAKYCIDLFEELVASIRPDQRFMDLCERYVGARKRERPTCRRHGARAHLRVRRRPAQGIHANRNAARLPVSCSADL
jgi:hypothetical protein